MDENKKNGQNDEDKLEDFNQDESINKIVEKYSLDPENDADLIEKLVAEEEANHKKLSDAIGQKIKYRNEVQGLKDSNGKESKKESVETKPEDVSKLVQAELDKRDLEELNLSDELQAELKKIAALNGTTVKKAAQDPYFVYKKEQSDKADRVSKASTSKKTGGSPAYVAGDKPPTVDLSTKEGRDEWKRYKDSLKDSLKTDGK